MQNEIITWEAEPEENVAQENGDEEVDEEPNVDQEREREIQGLR